MNVLTRPFLVAFIVITGLFLMQSCCNEQYAISGVGYGYINGTFADTFQGSIPMYDGNDSLEIILFSDAEFVACLPNVHLVRPTYALSCEYTPTNFIKSSTVRLSFTQAIQHEGTPYAAGHSIVGMPGVKGDVAISYLDDAISFSLSSEFMQAVQWSNEPMSFQFNAVTNDGVELSYTSDLFQIR